jgi:hypothetical protein
MLVDAVKEQIITNLDGLQYVRLNRVLAKKSRISLSQELVQVPCHAPLLNATLSLEQHITPPIRAQSMLRLQL